MTSTPYATLLLGLGMLTFSAPARAAPVIRAEREVVLPGVAGHEAPTVYGAADFPLTLVFDGPLRKEGLTLPGADLRLHPFIADGVLLTPSKALAAQSAVPLRVPLADGTSVELRLAFIPGWVDGRVRIVRRSVPLVEVAAKFENPRALADEALRLAATAVLGGRRLGCNSIGMVMPRRVKQLNAGGLSPLVVCLVPPLAYIKARPLCSSPEVGVRSEGGKPAGLLFAEVACPQGQACTAMLVMRSPAQEEPSEVTLEFMEADGTVCARFPSVGLQP